MRFQKYAVTSQTKGIEICDKEQARNYGMFQVRYFMITINFRFTTIIIEV